MELLESIVQWRYWDAILSILVIVHLLSEYSHYIWEFISGRREANILNEIHNHRKSSTKTRRLIHLQVNQDLIMEDLERIKSRLNIKN